MNQYGLSVVDDFLGREKGLQILNEVHKMYSAGMFKVRFLIISKLYKRNLINFLFDFIKGWSIS